MNFKYKISSSDYFTDPYPHIIKDNIFDNELLDLVKKNWPDDNLFYNEIPGIKLLDLYSSIRKKESIYDRLISFIKKKKLNKKSLSFWKNFVEDHVLKINKEIYKSFKQKLFSKFKIYKTPDISQLNLMHASNKFIQHHVHNHHYHNPNWTFTVLIYIDDENIKTPGTDIYEVRKSNNKISLENLTNFSIVNPILSAQNRKIKKSKTVDFKQNRLFAFLDTPISYHGVKKTNITKSFNSSSRKIVRMHCSYHDDTVKKIYGVSLPQYKKIRQTTKPKKLTNPDNNIYKGIKYELTKLLTNG